MGWSLVTKVAFGRLSDPAGRKERDREGGASCTPWRLSQLGGCVTSRDQRPNRRLDIAAVFISGSQPLIAMHPLIEFASASGAIPK